MSRIVLDASVIGPLIIPDEASDLRDDVLLALASGIVVVPQHWRLEVANLARMAVRKKRLDDIMLPAIVSRLSDYLVEVDTETDRNAWSGILDLSRRHDLTIYDAGYLELTLRVGARLATSDRRLSKAAAAHDVLLGEA